MKHQEVTIASFKFFTSDKNDEAEAAYPACN